MASRSHSSMRADGIVIIFSIIKKVLLQAAQSLSFAPPNVEPDRQKPMEKIPKTFASPELKDKIQLWTFFLHRVSSKLCAFRFGRKHKLCKPGTMFVSFDFVPMLAKLSASELASRNVNVNYQPSRVEPCKRFPKDNASQTITDKSLPCYTYYITFGDFKLLPHLKLCKFVTA